MSLNTVRTALKKEGNSKQAKVNQGFFKTQPGQYGHGDVFLGVMMPTIRRLGHHFSHLPRTTLSQLLRSKIHEERLLALTILVQQFQEANESGRGALFRFYVKHLPYVNNWDLVDGSAPHIVGPYLLNRKRTMLHTWAKSKRLWDRRVAIVATWYFIRQGEYRETLKLAKVLVQDREDLIHKAVGWMLREVGKRDLATEEQFLQVHYRRMPRTMLRYAIERFPEANRKKYLNGLL